MKVLILHTLPPPQTEPGRWEWEFDLQGTADELMAVLPGAAVLGVRGEPREMLDAIASAGPDVVFNLCEAPLGDPRLEPHAAALFEWLRLPFTGSGSEALACCRRKDVSKRILKSAGVPVPGDNGFPCIVKPLDEDGSAGIYADSICDDEPALSLAIERLNGRALVEEFLPGREFSVVLWGRSEPECEAAGEIVFTGGVRLLTYEGKWDMESFGYVNAPLVFDSEIAPPLRACIVDIAKKAWRATGLRGYATIDLRLNAGGVPCVLDINPNAALNSEGRVQRGALAAGWGWDRFVRQQVEWAF